MNDFTTFALIGTGILIGVILTFLISFVATFLLVVLGHFSGEEVVIAPDKVEAN